MNAQPVSTFARGRSTALALILISCHAAAGPSAEIPHSAPESTPDSFSSRSRFSISFTLSSGFLVRANTALVEVRGVIATDAEANADNLPIGIHHGSLSKEARRKVEGAMADGRLRALVCIATNPCFCAQPDWPLGMPAAEFAATFLRMTVSDLSDSTASKPSL